MKGENICLAFNFVKQYFPMVKNTFLNLGLIIISQTIMQ